MKGVTLELNDLGKKHLKDCLKKLLRPNTKTFQEMLDKANLNIEYDDNFLVISMLYTKSGRSEIIDFNPSHLKFKE